MNGLLLALAIEAGEPYLPPAAVLRGIEAFCSGFADPQPCRIEQAEAADRLERLYTDEHREIFVRCLKEWRNAPRSFNFVGVVTCIEQALRRSHE